MGMHTLSVEERAVVDILREFVGRDVKPVVRELEHANTYPEKLIEQMKQLGTMALTEPSGGSDLWSATSATPR
jgi:alkylation response protein AidB-like acyl-CoA dehydrogenase